MSSIVKREVYEVEGSFFATLQEAELHEARCQLPAVIKRCGFAPYGQIELENLVDIILDSRIRSLVFKLVRAPGTTV